MFLGYNIIYDLFSIGVLIYLISSIVFLYRRNKKVYKESIRLKNAKEELKNLIVVNKELKDTIEDKLELLKSLHDTNDDLSLNLTNMKRCNKYLEIECKKLVSLKKDKEDYIEELESRLKEKKDEIIELKEKLNRLKEVPEYNVLDEIKELLDLLTSEYSLEYLKRESSSKCISIVLSMYKELNTKYIYSVSYLLTIYCRYIKCPEYDSLLCFMDEKGYLKNGKSMLREVVLEEINNIYEDSMKLESVLDSILEM